MNVEQLVLESKRRTGSAQLVVPKKYVPFVDWLGVTMTPAQRVAALVGIDDLDPCELDGEEREVAKRLFGDIEVIPELAKQVLVAVCGRRGGKSYLLEGLPLLHAMYVVELFEVAPGQLPIALVISSNDELRQEVINYAFGACRHHPQLAETLVLSPGQRNSPFVSEFIIRRPTGELVGFRGGVATKGGYGGRGKSLVACALDEAAFFQDNTKMVNDEEIFGGAKPGLLPGAKMIVASTPWAQAGLLWRLFDENFGKPTNCLVVHAATQVMRPKLAAEVEQERLRDPEKCARERDAVFMAMGTTQFFPDSLIDSMFRKDVPYPVKSIPGTRSAAAADLGFRSDSSAFAGTVRLPSDPTIYGARFRELRPGPGKPLKPSETCQDFAKDAEELGCQWVMVDGHYIEAMRENARTLRVMPAPANPGEVYVAARQMIRDGLVAVAHPDTLTGEDRMMMLRLKAQMREVQGRPVPGGGMSIILPKWRTGGHCDLVSAFVLAIYQQGGELQAVAPPKEGSPAWEKQQLELRKRQMREKASAKWRPGAI